MKISKSVAAIYLLIVVAALAIVLPSLDGCDDATGDCAYEPIRY